MVISHGSVIAGSVGEQNVQIENNCCFHDFDFLDGLWFKFFF